MQSERGTYVAPGPTLALKQDKTRAMSPVPTWIDSEHSTGVYDPGTVCTNYGGTWSDSVCTGSVFERISTEANVALRLEALKYLQVGARDFRLRHDSPLISAAKLGDRMSAGVDIDKLEEVAGRLRAVEVLEKTPTSAKVTLLAPDKETACYVLYGTGSDVTSWSELRPSNVGS